MSNFPFPRVGGTLGAQPDQELVRVINRSAVTLAVGDLCMFDLHSISAETTDFVNGSTASVLASVIVPLTLGLTHGWFGIVTIAGILDTEVTVCVRGKVLASTINSPALVDILTAENGLVTLDADAPVAGEKILAIPLETGGATAELNWVLFNGIEGFGSAIDN